MTYKYGSTGDGVKELQTLLNKNGYSLKEDGIYGEKTQDAVKDYQKNNNLESNGEAGDETIGSLKGVFSAKSSSTPNSGESASQQNSFQNAQKKLSVLQKGYSDPLEETIDTLYDKVLNAPEFEYDSFGDPNYNQYAEIYERNAKLVSEDVMAQAAGLTGGFGSSYATAAASQAYNEHMSELNDIVPELRQNARSEWESERARDIDAISMLLNERDYERGVFESDRAFDESVRQYDENLAETKRQYNKSISSQREEIALSAGFPSWDDYVKAVKNGEFVPATTETDNFSLTEVQNAKNAYAEKGYAGLNQYISQLEQTGKNYSDDQFYSLMFNAMGLDQIKTREDAMKYLFPGNGYVDGHIKSISTYLRGTDASNKEQALKATAENIKTEDQWKSSPEYGSYSEYLKYTLLDIISEVN